MLTSIVKEMWWAIDGDWGRPLLIAAHLDTVFPESVDTTVTLREGRYYAPGIGDDTRGLAVLLLVIDVMNQFEIETVGNIIFSGNVGEEGRGDLRGVKALFRDLDGVDGFISVDGVRPKPQYRRWYGQPPL